MAKSNTIQFKGTFDGSQILNELKKVRASMSEAGASDTLFKNVDKDILATEKLVNDMMAQIQKGFSNTKEITAFEKQINKLQTNFLKISTGLKGANLSENFTFNSPEIAKLTQEINRLTAAQDRLKESSKNALATAGHNIGFNQDDVKEIQKAIDANEDLEESLIRVAKAKEKAAKANAGQTGMATDAGKEYIANAKAGLSLEDLGATAMSGKTARATADARARGAGGKLKRGSKGVRLDEDKAMAAVNETYQQALEETVRNGGSAVDAVEAMKKALADYGVQLSNTERLQENFAESLEGFYTGDIVGVGQKSAVTKAQKAGRTNAQGEFELSDDARRQVVNNSQITAYNQNLERTAQAERELATERERLVERAEQAQEEYNNSLKNTDRNVEEVTNSLREQAKATKDNSASQERMNEGFDNMKSAVKTFLSISSAANGLKNVIRSTFEDIKNLDKSFAEIAMVTDYSVGQMWESYGQYSEMANKLGQSTQGVIQASGLFYQQGLNTAESLALTEDTMKLATLAGTDFSEATSQMTAALRGFKMEMDEGNRVTDVYSELAAKAAADVQGIAYAMSKTASIAESAGMEFETTSAFLTQMIETTQEAPENIGTAMKTIIARFTELKENIAGTDKSEFDDLDYNKVDQALKSVGVSIKDASGQFRDLDDVFLELSGKWDTLDRNTQRYIATIAAGSRQQSRFIAMMDNYDRTVELVDTAYNSAGKSSEQFAKYQDTLEYKLNQLKNTWEQFRVQFFNSDFFKNILEGLNGLLTKISDFSAIDIVSLAGVWIIFGKTIIQNIITGVQNGTQGLMNVFSNIFAKIKAPLFQKFTFSADVTKAEGKIRSLEQKIQAADRRIEQNKIILDADTTLAMQKLKAYEAEYNRLYNKALSGGMSQEGATRVATFGAKRNTGITDDDIKKGKMGQQAKNRLKAATKSKARSEQTLEETTGNLKDLQSNAQARGQLIGQTLATSITMAITAVATADNPMEAFGQVMLTGIASLIPALVTMVTTAGGSMSAAFIASTAGIGALILGITAALAAVGVAIKNAFDNAEANKFENRMKEAKKRAEEAEKAAEEAASAAKTAADAFKSTEKLKERFTELNEKQALTTEEQEEYNELVTQIQDEFPQIISYYNEITGELRVQNDLWDEILTKQEAEAQQAAKENFLSANALNAANSTVKRFETISDYSTKTGLTKEALEEFLTNKNYDSKAITEEIAKSVGMSSGQGHGYAYLSQDIDIDKLAGLYGIDLDSYYDDTQGIQALTDLQKAIDQDSSRITDGLDGIRQVEEDLSKAEYEMIASNFGDVISAINPEMGEGEEKLRETIGKKAIEDAGINEMSYEQYKAEVNAVSKFNQNESFFDAFGGAWKGASDTSFSDWEDIDENRNIDDGGVLDRYGIKTTGDAKKKFLDSYASEAEAAEAWAEWQGDAAGQMKILERIINQAIYEQMEKANEAVELTDAQSEQLEQFYAEAMEEGTTNDEIEQLGNFLIGIGLNTEETDAFLKDLQETFDEAQEKMETFGIKDKTSEWSTDQMNQYASYIEGLSEIAGDKAAQNFGQEMVSKFQGLNMNADQLLSAFSAVDWSTIDLGNIDEAKEQFTAVMEEAMGESFDPQTVDQLWQDFFNTADKYNVVDLSISTKGGLESLQGSLVEDWTKNLEGLNNVSEIVAEQLTNGFISFSSSQSVSEALAEMGMEVEKYLNYSENGEIDLKTDKLKQDLLEDQGLTAEALLEKAREETEEKLQQIDAQIALLQAGQGQVENAKVLINEYGIQVGLLNQMANIMNKMKLINYTEDMTTTNSLLNSVKLIDDASAEEALKSLEEQRKLTQDFLDNELVKGSDTYKKMISQEKAYMNEVNSIFANVASEAADATKEQTDSYEELLEAQKKYEEALHGTAEWLDEQDPFKALTESVSLLEKKLEGLKSSLEEVTSPDQAKNLLNAVTENRTLQIENLTGQMQMAQSQYDQVLDFIQNGDYAQYYSQLPDGTFSFDITKWYEEGGSDEMGDALGEMVTKGNDAAISVLESQQKINDIQKEQEKESEERLKNYVSLQDQILEILKQNAEEEVKTQKEKYDALKEADNDYLSALEEAIEKQRKLREQENEYEDLTQKEKKLALMQRDTSGTNQKEINELQKEVEEQRQELLDSKIDEMIDKLKQQTELQTEIRDMEIEIKENELESKNYLAELAAVESSFHNADDVVAWMLENNKELEDMSIEQQEAKILEWEELGTHWAAYLGEKESGYTDLLTTTEENIEAFAQAGTDAIEGSIERIITNEQAAQAQRELDAKKALEETSKAYDEAIAKHNEWLNTLKQEKNTDNNNNNKSKKVLTGTARDEAYKSMKNDFKNNYLSRLDGLTGIAKSEATKTVKNDFFNKYSNNKDIAEEIWNNEMVGTYNPENKWKKMAETEGTAATVKKARGLDEPPISNFNQLFNGDTERQKNLRNFQQQTIKENDTVYSIIKLDPEDKNYGYYEQQGVTSPIWFDSENEAKKYYENSSDKENLKAIMKTKKQNGVLYHDFLAFATGGLVNYTGPAWVDGSPSKPEAFLSAQDTERIGNAAKLLADLPILNSTSNANNAVSSNIGDTSIEIHINVENLASDYDVDQMIERVKNDILDVSKPTGTSVILHK